MERNTILGGSLALMVGAVTPQCEKPTVSYTDDPAVNLRLTYERERFKDLCHAQGTSGELTPLVEKRNKFLENCKGETPIRWVCRDRIPVSGSNNNRLGNFVETPHRKEIKTALYQCTRQMQGHGDRGSR